MAAYKGHTEVTRLLLAGGAQWDAVDPGGHDALWVAGMKGHHEIVKLLEARAATPAGQLPDTH
jgi:ankyrin repeat protein